MEKVELIQQAVRAIIDSEEKIILISEYDKLKEESLSRMEKMAYVELFNYFLGCKQQEVIANERKK